MQSILMALLKVKGKVKNGGKLRKVLTKISADRYRNLAVTAGAKFFPERTSTAALNRWQRVKRKKH